jgi:hypothetical protein
VLFFSQLILSVDINCPHSLIELSLCFDWVCQFLFTYSHGDCGQNVSRDTGKRLRNKDFIMLRL